MKPASGRCSKARFTGRCGVKPQRLRYFPTSRFCISMPNRSAISALIAGRLHKASGSFICCGVLPTIRSRSHISSVIFNFRWVPTGRPRRFSPNDPSPSRRARVSHVLIVVGCTPDTADNSATPIPDCLRSPITISRSRLRPFGVSLRASIFLSLYHITCRLF